MNAIGAACEGPILKRKSHKRCPLTAQAFLECVHCDGPCVFDIEALPSMSKWHLQYWGVQIIFDIEVCLFDIDVEIWPSISKLYLRYWRLEICFDIVKMYSISKIFNIRYDISITNSLISTLQDFNIGCLQYRIRYTIMWASISNNTYTDIEVPTLRYRSASISEPDIEVQTSILTFRRYWRFVDIDVFLVTTISNMVTSISRLLYSMSKKASIW